MKEIIIWEDYPDPNFHPNKVDMDKRIFNVDKKRINFTNEINTITT